MHDRTTAIFGTITEAELRRAPACFLAFIFGATVIYSAAPLVRWLAEALTQRAGVISEARFSTAAAVMAALLPMLAAVGAAAGYLFGSILDRRISQRVRLAMWRLFQTGALMLCVAMFALCVKGLFTGNLPVLFYASGVFISLAAGSTLVEPGRSWMRANFWKNVGR